MPNSEVCVQCSGPIPVDVPLNGSSLLSAVCPACLLQAGLKEFSKCGDEFASEHASIAPVHAPALSQEQLVDLFPNLEIISLIGQGGMGVVYRARQKKLDRIVALKIIRSDVAADPAFGERFHREARTLARLNHPGIVAVYDFGEAGPPDTSRKDAPSLFYFVMEFVDGSNLRQLMSGGPLPVETSFAMIPQICDALQSAHDEGIVHRDIKPENILNDRKGRVRIADFGLARLVTPHADEHTLTGTHQVMGTPRYMAPEQMEGARTIDHRADIYSLGVVFYEMLTGQVPAGHFKPPSHKRPISHHMDSLVLRAMARDPEHRFQQVSDLGRDFQAALRALPAAERGDASALPADPATVSEILSREVAATLGWLGAGRERAAPVPPLIGWFGALLSVVVMACMFQPWLNVYITDRDATVLADRTLPEPTSGATALLRQYLPLESATGVVASLALTLLMLMQFAAASTGSTRMRARVSLLLGGIAVAALLLFRIEISHSLIDVYAHPETGELPRHFVEFGGRGRQNMGSAWLYTLEHQDSLTTSAVTGLTSLFLVLILNAVILPRTKPTSILPTVGSGRES